LCGHLPMPRSRSEMSTEAAGEAKQETVEAGREVTAVTVEADEAPGAGGNAERADRGQGAGNGTRAADDGTEPGEDDAESGRPSAVPGADEAGEDAAGEEDGEGGQSDANGGHDADDDGTEDDAGDDEDPDEADWPDDGLPPDEDDLAYDEYEYGDDDYAGDEEHGPDDGSGRARRWPRVLLVIGFVLAAVAIIGGALAIVGSVTHGFKKPVKVTYKKSALFSLKTGDCFNPLGQAYTLTSCDVPHQAEVFATFALAAAKYPGSTAIAATAAQECASRLTGYLNPQLAISLASTYVYPDATAWQAGTRTVICEVQASSGQLTGSVRGASATAG
jgi:Septum formation